MLTPRLGKHVRNFSWLITGSRDPSHSVIMLYSVRVDLKAMLCQNPSDLPDLNCVYSKSAYMSANKKDGKEGKRVWALNDICTEQWLVIEIKKIEAESIGDIVSHLLVKQHSGVDSWCCQDQRKPWKERAREWTSKTEHEPERVRRVGLQYNQH